MKTIQYAFDDITGLTWSRVGSEVAVPLLDYPGEDTHLEKFTVIEMAHHMDHLRWTKKLPTSLKNYHREFWGMKQLKTRKETA